MTKTYDLIVCHHHEGAFSLTHKMDETYFVNESWREFVISFERVKHITPPLIYQNGVVLNEKFYDLVKREGPKKAEDIFSKFFSGCGRKLVDLDLRIRTMIDIRLDEREGKHCAFLYFTVELV